MSICSLTIITVTVIIIIINNNCGVFYEFLNYGKNKGDFLFVYNYTSSGTTRGGKDPSTHAVRMSSSEGYFSSCKGRGLDQASGEAAAAPCLILQILSSTLQQDLRNVCLVLVMQTSTHSMWESYTDV